MAPRKAANPAPKEEEGITQYGEDTNHHNSPLSTTISSTSSPLPYYHYCTYGYPGLILGTNTPCRRLLHHPRLANHHCDYTSIDIASASNPLSTLSAFLHPRLLYYLHHSLLCSSSRTRILSRCCLHPAPPLVSLSRPASSLWPSEQTARANLGFFLPQDPLNTSRSSLHIITPLITLTPTSTILLFINLRTYNTHHLPRWRCLAILPPTTPPIVHRDHTTVCAPTLQRLPTKLSGRAKVHAPSHDCDATISRLLLCF